jgi:hypothetical protein
MESTTDLHYHQHYHPQHSNKPVEMGEFQLIGVQKIGQSDLQYIVQPDITLIGAANAAMATHHNNAMLTGGTATSGHMFSTGGNGMTSDSGDLLHAFLPLLDRSNLNSPVSFGLSDSKHADIVYAELQQLRSPLDQLNSRHSLASYSTPTKLPIDSPTHNVHSNAGVTTTDPTLDLLCDRALLHQLTDKKALSNSTNSPLSSLPAASMSNSISHNKALVKQSNASSNRLSRIVKHSLLWLLLACAVVLAVLCLTTLAHTTLLFGKFSSSFVA